MKEVSRTPILEAETSTGKKKFWFGSVMTSNGKYYTQSEAWTVNKDGVESKHLISEPREVEKKNVGKKNETTLEDQAFSELQTKLDKQIDKGYVEMGKKRVSKFTLPMLAHSIDKKKHKVVFPCLIQPKYNGIRCLYNSKLGFWSRQANELIKEVTAHLQFNTLGYTVDGELLLPYPYTFQETISAVKKFDPEISPKLQYVIYDVADTEMKFEDRWEFLNKILIHNLPAGSVMLSETETVNVQSDIVDWHKIFVGKRYEGSILRNPAGFYTPGHRSDALLKYKDFVDAEFTIIGFEEGAGKDKGAIIFKCITPEGKEFAVRPEGPYKDRQTMFKNGKSFINKKLTVRYQTLTDDKVPLFPVGVTVRDYE